MGIAQQPEGLAAVVAQEPVYAGYRYLYINGVRFRTSALDGPRLQRRSTSLPGTINDTAEYHAQRAPPTPPATRPNIGQQQHRRPSAGVLEGPRPDPGRRAARRSPLFLTQGFLEDNTKPDGAWDFFNASPARKRAWFGQWDHVRGKTHRHGASAQPAWAARAAFAEVMRFYDRYLKGERRPRSTTRPSRCSPATAPGAREEAWPPADSRRSSTTLNVGTYADDSGNDGTGVGRRQRHLDDLGRHCPTTSTSPACRAITVDVPDDAAQREPRRRRLRHRRRRQGDARSAAARSCCAAAACTASTSTATTGRSHAGHRIGVLITGSNAEWFTHVPTQQTVTVRWRAHRPAVPGRGASERPRGHDVGQAGRVQARRAVRRARRRTDGRPRRPSLCRRR